MKKELKGLYDLCKEKGLTDAELLPYFRTIESNLKTKRYGLVWEEQLEDIASDIKNKFPILVEREDLSIKADPNGLTNCLIEGDNYESLTFLKNSGVKVDCIYIDPPYNTGNKDFIYNDKYIDSEDTWRHSSWLSFMNKRLKLAKELLTEDGVIFISIDDNEISQLKLLCDQIFGECNFIAKICVELSKTQGMKVKTAQEGNIVKNHEYILVYSKIPVLGKKNRTPLYDSTTPYDKHFKYVLEDGNLTNLIEYIKNNPVLSQEFIERNLDIKYENIDKLLYLSESFKDKFLNEISKKLYRLSMITSKKIQELPIAVGSVVKHSKYLLVKNSKGTVEQLQSFYDTLQVTDDYNPEFTRATIRGALWKGFYSDMMNVSKESHIDFKNGKKPKRLIKQLFKWANRPDGLFLDFFAGSGTTGHAVLELNKEDAGNRKFILCTNNENNIAETVTHERLKRVILGYTTPKGKEVNGIHSNLKYYKVEKLDSTLTQMETEDEIIENIIPFIQFKHNAWEKETVVEDLIKLTSEKEGIYVHMNKLYLCNDFYASIKRSGKPTTLYIYDGLFEMVDEDRLGNVKVLSLTNEFYKN